MVSPCLLLSAPIATAFGNCLYVPGLRQIVYIMHCKKNVKKLKTMRADVQMRVDYARASGEVITGQVDEWLERARPIDEVNVNGTCFCSPISRYILGKEAKTLLGKGNFSAVSSPAPHPSIESIPTRDFVEFGSTKSAMNQVIDALKDVGINIVGVYGLGGVGKTTLMEQVGKQMKKENLYNEVVKVTVSQNPDSKRIQDEIAEKLGLRFNETNEEVRAARLSARLKKEKTVLLILDDLWDRLDLPKIGIPSVDEHKGCKIVVTSRNLHVCNVMKSQQNINVQVLSDDDSWLLFKKHAGDFIESLSFRSVAKDVVKECGGLPLAMATLGRALSDKDLTYWKGVLVQLQRSTTSNIGMDAKLSNSLMASYDAIGSKEMKLCFLLCCLFPEDFNISVETLMQYGIGEGFYKEVLSLEEARERVHISVVDLKARCLLLEGDRKGTVKMHDIIRDLAIKISSEDEHKCLVKARLGLKKWPEREEVDKYHRISLVGNEISMLPDKPRCSNLRTLLLSRNRSLKEIPNNFFIGMETLVVLDLSDTKISSLPSSSARLINLRTLCLDRCRNLRDLNLIGGLKELEILSIRYNSIIGESAAAIGKLTNLKLLDLSGTRYLMRPNVAGSLPLLEELYMTGGFSKWELQQKENGHGDTAASINELILLPHLTVLHIDIQNTNILSQDVSIARTNLREFCIRVGQRYVGSADRALGGKRCMCLDVCGPVANWVKDLAERTEHLSLTVCNSCVNVEPIFNRNPGGLKSLRIHDWGEREHVISVEEVSGNAFGTLETLCIEKMNKLRKLCDGPIQPGFFGNLRHLSVEECGKLVTLLPTVLLQRLNNLECISVKTCHELQEVFDQTEKGEDGDAILTKLTKLKLRSLTNLIKIWKGHVPLGSFQSFKVFYLEYCDSLKYLLSPSQGQAIQQLKFLYIHGCEIMEGLIMPREEEERGVMEGIASSHTTNSPNLPPPLLSFFQNLRQLLIGSCPSFKSIFSWQLACGLKQLELLQLWNFNGMQLIIGEAEEEVGMVDSSVLPQLKRLYLEYLPSLASFCEGEVLLNMASLEVVIVSECNNLKRLPLGPQSAPNLKKIYAPKEWFEELEWGEDNITKSRLQSLFEEIDWPPLQRGFRLQLPPSPPPSPPSQSPSPSLVDELGTVRSESDDVHEMGTGYGASDGSGVESEIGPEASAQSEKYAITRLWSLFRGYL